MNRATAVVVGCACLVAGLACASVQAVAQPVAVHCVEGTVHGFLALRGQDGKVLAAGELAQVARGSTVTAHLVFRFRDGSVDDETTVFSERGSFRLISDHHIQQGPSFPKPMDLTIDVAQGRVTSRAPGKDGKPEPATYQVKLPPDLVNGMVGMVVKNIKASAPETKASLLVMTPKPRVVTLNITPHGEDPFDVIGLPRKALHYTIHIQVGGVTGAVASLIGKQPPDVQLWVLGGEAPTFLRSESQSFEDGPIWTTEFASPDWPKQTSQ